MPRGRRNRRPAPAAVGPGALIPYVAPVAVAGAAAIGEYVRGQLMRASPGTMYETARQYYNWWYSLTPEQQLAIQTHAGTVVNATRSVVNYTGTVAGRVARAARDRVRRNTPERVVLQRARTQGRSDRNLAVARRPYSLGRSRALTPARSRSRTRTPAVSRSRQRSLTPWLRSRVQPGIDTGTGTSTSVARYGEQLFNATTYDTGSYRLLRTDDGRLIAAGRAGGNPDPPSGNSFVTAYPRFIRDPTSYRRRARVIRRYIRRSKKSISY